MQQGEQFRCLRFPRKRFVMEKIEEGRIYCYELEGGYMLKSGRKENGQHGKSHVFELNDCRTIAGNVIPAESQEGVDSQGQPGGNGSPREKGGTMTEYREVPLAAVTPAKDNPRKHVGDIDELAKSVQAVGVLEPLIVVKQATGNQYTIVAGHRRYAAASKAKSKTIPVLVRDLPDAERVEVMLIENLHREDLSPMEEAETYKRLLDLTKGTQRDLANRVGRSQAHVSKRLALLELPKEAVTALTEGKIDVSDAIELTKLKHQPDVKTVLGNMRDGYHPNIKMLVERQNEEQDYREKLAKVVDANKGAVIEERRSSGGARKVTEVGPGTFYGLDKVDVKKHKSEPCHAIIVEWDGAMQEGCSDPSRHGVKDNGRRSSTEKTQKEWREFQKRFKEIREKRRGFVADQLKARQPAAYKQAIMVEALLQHSHADTVKIACGLLGIDPDTTHEVPNYTGPFRSYVTSGPENEARAGLALAFAGGEERLSGSPWGHDEAAEAYLAALRELGYRTTKDERDYAAGKVKTGAY